jgi:hypothetical protein
MGRGEVDISHVVGLRLLLLFIYRASSICELYHLNIKELPSSQKRKKERKKKGGLVDHSNQGFSFSSKRGSKQLTNCHGICRISCWPCPLSPSPECFPLLTGCEPIPRKLKVGDSWSTASLGLLS